MYLRLKTVDDGDKKVLALVNGQDEILHGLIEVEVQNERDSICPVVVAKFYLDDEAGVQLG